MRGENLDTPVVRDPGERPKRYSLRRWRLFFLERGARARLSVKISVDKKSLEIAVKTAACRDGLYSP
jgi:hypothetical protein